MSFPPTRSVRKTTIQPSRSSFGVLLGGHSSVIDSSTAANSSRSPGARGQQRHSGETLQLVERKPRYQAACDEPARSDFDHREIGVDPLHHADSGERISAALYDLGPAFFGEMLHHHAHVLRPDREINRA